jgi:subtilisin family serine protease
MTINKSQAHKMDSRIPLPILSLLLSIILISAAFGSDNLKHWVYFKDYTRGEPIQLSQKAIERCRQRGVRSQTIILECPPAIQYIDQLKSTGLTIHQVSRWLNAVSVTADSSQLVYIAVLPFINRIKPVASFRGDRLQKSSGQVIPQRLQNDQLDYGPSLSQVRLEQIDSLQGLGYDGSNILIGIMDTGFDLAHPSFDSILNRGGVIATYDFINNDANVQDQPDIQQSHGTAIWSVLGGFDEGSLIGPAYGADYVLAKTEIVSQEIRSEEDNWIAAAEWMDSLGVDIISSSLGYIDWYDTTQLDGHTCAITLAAEAAAARGIAVVNVAGNERNNFAWRKIIPPSDGDSVIAVGAVDASGALASFSSPGPTADGRIKPDIMGQGLFVRAANFENNGYGSFDGTSVATPIIAGGLALILEAHPDWGLDKLYGSLRGNGSQANSPNNDYGWGIARFFDQFAINGYFIVEQPPDTITRGDTIDIAIALYDSTGHSGGIHQISVQLVSGTAVLIGEPRPSGVNRLIQSVYFPLPGAQRLLVRDEIADLIRQLDLSVGAPIPVKIEIWPNPAIDSVIFVYSLDRPSWAEIAIFTIAGDKIDAIRINSSPSVNSYIWPAKNRNGESIASGIYIAHLRSSTGSQTSKFAFIKN